MKKVYGVGTYSSGKFTRLISGKISPHYKTWQHMLERCYSKVLNETDSRSYRDRGVKVCDEWADFQTFAAEKFTKYF